MNDRTILLLAAGKSHRWQRALWPESYPKQLLDIGGELMIQRIVRQVRARGLEPIVVTHDPKIIEVVPGVEIFYPKATRWIMETVWSTWEVWRGICTAFYTDILYSKAVMDAMLFERRSRIFYGQWGNGFGFVWHANDLRWQEGLQVVIADAERIEAEAPGTYEAGRNWELYRWFQGWDMHTHIGPEASNEFWEFVPYSDYTRDIDTPPDWEAAQRDILQAGRLDDLPEGIKA